MKKILLTLGLFTALAGTTYAQTKSGDTGKLSIGLEAGLPVGSASDYFNSIIGGSVKYDYPITNNLFITGSAGYSRIGVKTFDLNYSDSFSGEEYNFHSGGGSVGIIPVKAGVKYYLNGRFFGEGQIGAAFSTESGGGTLFVYSPGVGYTFNGGLEAGVRYEAWSNNGTIGQMALRLAYRF